MSIDMLYIICAAIPLLVMPFMMPIVSLMARRKHFTDSPNYRKHQSYPVMVTGGLVIVITLAITLMVANVFYDISTLFPVICSILIFFVFGMLDDAVVLNYKVKFVIQILILLLLFFCGNFRAYGLNGVFGIDRFSFWISLIVTIFLGLMYINSINFIDGIDGLASGLGFVSSLFLAKWHSLLGYYDMTILSFAMAGVMFMFFVFNVFSERFKMYMGDSGSLVLGLYIFVSVCPNTQIYEPEASVMTEYAMAFFMALFSVPLFDMARIVLLRIAKRHSPFQPDRTHLHHALVDMGMSHFFATIHLIMLTGLVLLVWYLLALTGMNRDFHCIIVFGVAWLLVWGHYFFIEYMRKKNGRLYVWLSRRLARINAKTEWIREKLTYLIDHLIVR